jgi:tryptophan synthase alpha chain
VSRLGDRFAHLRSQGEKALVCFITAGDPSAQETVEIVRALDHAGVDAVEIGIPFSDPLADGPSIQAASQRSLEAGTTTRGVLNMVSEIRKHCDTLPIVLMTYLNPILHYGLERWAEDARQAGADAHIVTDLTPEESDDWVRISREKGLDTIFLLAPTSTPARIEAAAGRSTGFIYCVSRTGVTGARQDVPAEVTDVVRGIKAHSRLPVCVGFGLSQSDHVRTICGFADGAVVGSALVDLVHAHASDPNMLLLVHNYALALKEATIPR